MCIFAAVLLLLSAGAYEFVARQYTALLAPALGTPEAAIAYREAMRRVLLTIIAFDLPLLAFVGLASWLLARASLRPLVEATERERAFGVDAAHALRSPLATIASVAQAARDGAEDTSRAAFDTIAHAALDASSVITDLLTLSRSAHARGLAREPVDLGAIAADTSKEYAAIAHDRGISLEQNFTSTIIEGDERRLRELVRNLLDNATRHANSAVRIDAVRDGRFAELRVTNDGQPIPAELRERIFERFFSANGAQGSGLGLAIVRWIAHAHGGTAFVREGGSGSPEFVVRLPALP